MVGLLCFCCDHRNPAGAKFCNACGTPLHLKPCKHCEAINVRAAAHCHQCGETFALEFLALDESLLPDAPGAAEEPAPAEVADEVPYSRPRRRDVFTTRIAALLLTLTATALLSAYYAYRQPASGVDAAVINAHAESAGLAVMPVALPTHSPPAGAPASPGTTERPGRSAARAATVADANVNRAMSFEAKKADSHSGSGRNAQASPARTKQAPLQRANRPRRVEQVASSPPAGREQNALPPRADPAPIALQQTASASPARTAAANTASVQRSASPKHPTSAFGASERPCAEGCDVRIIQKGD
jgi:Double zinc ribbon